MSNLFLFYGAVFVLVSFPVYSYTLGVSPHKISFEDAEEKIIVINPSAYTIKYQINGCDYPFLHFLKKGEIAPKEKRILTFQYNPSLNKNLSNCTAFISTENNVYSTGLEVKLYFPINLDDKFSDINFNFPEENSNKEKIKYAPLIVASIILLVGLFFIVKFF